MTTNTSTEGQTIHWARLYDLSTELFGGRVRALHRSVVELAAISPGDRVLDVGCGPGRLTLTAALAAGPAGEILGIDPSPEMIALATRKAKRVGSSAAFRVAGIEAIPAPDNHFDAVLASLMLHHLPPELQRRGLAEVLRVLKPEGRFVAADFRATPGHGVGHFLCVLGLRRGSEHAEHLRSQACDAGFEAIQVEPALRAFCLLSARKPAPKR
jgi:ubiquinone/menaquinone biosynthesis C-methylase UbiE